MMGRLEDRQGQFLYEFNLDEVVPAEHLVRRVDAVLDLGWVHKELAPYYSHTGRPSRVRRFARATSSAWLAAGRSARPTSR